MIGRASCHLARQRGGVATIGGGATAHTDPTLMTRLYTFTISHLLEGSLVTRL